MIFTAPVVLLHHAKFQTMPLESFSFTKLALKCYHLIRKHFRIPNGYLHKNFHTASSSQFETKKFQLLALRSDVEDHFLIFHVEKALLRSPSPFPYFMLVAFEAGSLIRAVVLFLSYPFICLCSADFALKVMVMVCFLGLKKDKFLEGRSVLPKFFLQDVGKECFEVLKRGKKLVAVSDFPTVMVESFLKNYLEVDFVVGRELKVFCGYYVGFMEKRSELVQDNAIEILSSTSKAIGITSSSKKCLEFHQFPNCKEIYLVSERERENWEQLPRDLYPKPLVFHDGRLAFRPTFLASLFMFIWLPLGFHLAIIRLLFVLSLPFQIKCPMLHFIGAEVSVLKPKNSVSPSKENNTNAKGVLYVCNHRTLLDPVILSYCLRTPLTAVTYSLSWVSEMFAPMRIVRLTRNRDTDAKLMHKVLTEGDLVVCPEGTTCREPYLLRFSPLFSEITEKILPVAMDCHVSMFYGTTAKGLKFLDPLFFFMNPWPSYYVRFVDTEQCKCDEFCDDESENSKFKKCNMVQEKIADELGFTCTKLTRKDKYLMLAGNDGFV